MRIKAIMNRRPGTARSASLIVLAASAVLSPVALAQTLMTDRVEQQVPVYVEALPAVAPLAAVRREPAAEPVPVPVAEPRPEPMPRATAAPLPATLTQPVEPVLAPQAERADLTVEADTMLVRHAPNADGTQQVIASGRVNVSLAADAPDFTHPVTEGRITSLYGDRPAQPAGAPRMHHGVDVAAPLGTAITAPAAGVVSHAEMGFDGSARWGNTVVIDHGDGWSTLYAHMHGIDVELGEVVQAGGQIGRVGSTGASTGPHVHVELRYNDERIDPGEHILGLPAQYQLK